MTDLAKRLRDLAGEDFIELSDIYGPMENNPLTGRVTLPLAQSISARTKGLVSSKDYNLIVIDECHHALRFL